VHILTTKTWFSQKTKQFRTVVSVDRQTDEQMTSPDALRRSCCRKQRFNNATHVSTAGASGGQFSLSVWPHNPATLFRPPSATVVSAEPFSHRTGTLRCLQKEMATDRHWSVSCGETQTMSHIVESCPLTKLNFGLSRLHSADEDAVSWLTNYGKWHTYEKKKIIIYIIIQLNDVISTLKHDCSRNGWKGGVNL